MPRSTTFRVLLDANVIFSGVHSPQGTPGRLLREAAEGHVVAVASVAVLKEVVRNLNHKLGMEPPGLGAFIASRALEIRRDPPAALTDIWASRGFGTDATVIASAVEAEVDYLCTGDRHLLRELPAYEAPFRTVSPAQLLASSMALAAETHRALS